MGVGEKNGQGKRVHLVGVRDDAGEVVVRDVEAFGRGEVRLRLAVGRREKGHKEKEERKERRGGHSYSYFRMLKLTML